MVRIEWSGAGLSVRRLVLDDGLTGPLRTEVLELADVHGLGLSNGDAEPQPGDLWLGVYPERGWVGLDPRLVGWAQGVEVPLALAQLARVASVN